MTKGNPGRCDMLQHIDMMTYSSKRITDFEKNENLAGSKLRILQHRTNTAGGRHLDLQRQYCNIMTVMTDHTADLQC
jgi:hypothetical protein